MSNAGPYDVSKVDKNRRSAASSFTRVQHFSKKRYTITALLRNLSPRLQHFCNFWPISRTMKERRLATADDNDNRRTATREVAPGGDNDSTTILGGEKDVVARNNMSSSLSQHAYVFMQNLVPIYSSRRSPRQHALFTSAEHPLILKSR